MTATEPAFPAGATCTLEQFWTYAAAAFPTIAPLPRGAEVTAPHLHAANYAVLDIVERKAYAQPFESYDHFERWMRAWVGRWAKRARVTVGGECLVNPLEGWNEEAGADTPLPLARSGRASAGREIPYGSANRGDYFFDTPGQMSERLNDLAADAATFEARVRAGTTKRRRQRRPRIECPYCDAPWRGNRSMRYTDRACPDCHVAIPAGVSVREEGENLRVEIIRKPPKKVRPMPYDAITQIERKLDARALRQHEWLEGVSSTVLSDWRRPSAGEESDEEQGSQAWASPRYAWRGTWLSARFESRGVDPQDVQERLVQEVAKRRQRAEAVTAWIFKNALRVRGQKNVLGSGKDRVKLAETVFGHRSLSGRKQVRAKIQELERRLSRYAHAVRALRAYRDGEPIPMTPPDRIVLLHDEDIAEVISKQV